ncbi:MAG: hypothetical protein CEO12_58 [Parcubacteria group bacterium Gr01-1014_46]|nr:MAG: hypothetical protein CEO12_58 [Parcubacteria group bacterium Gr01-1014_46]
MLLRKGDHSVWATSEGGSILSWQWREHNILGPARFVRVDGELKLRGETHWCYPNFGSVPEGANFNYPKHGHLRNVVLDIERLYDDSAQFYLPSNRTGNSTEVRVDLGVHNWGVSTWLSAINRGDERVPMLVGSHPYFVVPEDGLEVWVNGKLEAEVVRLGAGLLQSAGVFSKARILPRFGGRVAVNLKGLGEVHLGLHDHCSHIVIWSDCRAEYICVEPVFGEPGEFGTEEGNWLSKNESTFCQVDFNFKPRSV